VVGLFLDLIGAIGDALEWLGLYDKKTKGGGVTPSVNPQDLLGTGGIDKEALPAGTVPADQEQDYLDRGYTWQRHGSTGQLFLAPPTTAPTVTEPTGEGMYATQDALNKGMMEYAPTVENATRYQTSTQDSVSALTEQLQALTSQLSSSKDGNEKGPMTATIDDGGIEKLSSAIASAINKSNAMNYGNAPGT
jgi:hypothetical protein